MREAVSQMLGYSEAEAEAVLAKLDSLNENARAELQESRIKLKSIISRAWMSVFYKAETAGPIIRECFTDYNILTAGSEEDFIKLLEAYDKMIRSTAL